MDAADTFKHAYSWALDSYVTKIKINKKLLPTKFITPYRHVIIEIGKTYESALEIYNDAIHEGIHSFARLNDLKEFLHDVTENQAISIAKCIIPKGSKYFIGTFEGEDCYASDKLTYLELIE